MPPSISNMDNDAVTIKVRRVGLRGWPYLKRLPYFTGNTPKLELTVTHVKNKNERVSKLALTYSGLYLGMATTGFQANRNIYELDNPETGKPYPVPTKELLSQQEGHYTLEVTLQGDLADNSAERILGQVVMHTGDIQSDSVWITRFMAFGLGTTFSVGLSALAMYMIYLATKTNCPPPS